MTAVSARWIAAVRARESERPDRLFDDPYANELAGPEGFATMRRSEQATGAEDAYIPVRVRWFDDAILAAVAGGIGQVVALGAGLDTRPYRLGLGPHVYWYELDRAPTFAHKERVLAGVEPTCRRSIVAADLADDWPCALREAGFDPMARTLWLAEGLFIYLGEALILATLRSAARFCATGSILIADVIGTVGLHSPAMRSYRNWSASQQLPLPYASADPRPVLAAGGWPVRHLTTPGAADANFGRLRPLPGWVAGGTHLLVAQRAATRRRSG